MIGIFELHHILILLPSKIVTCTHMPFEFLATLRQELYKSKTDQEDN